MIRRPPRSTQSRSSAASDVYKRQLQDETPGAQGENGLPGGPKRLGVLVHPCQALPIRRKRRAHESTNVDVQIRCHPRNHKRLAVTSPCRQLPGRRVPHTHNHVPKDRLHLKVTEPLETPGPNISCEDSVNLGLLLLRQLLQSNFRHSQPTAIRRDTQRPARSPPRNPRSALRPLCPILC